MSRPQRPGLKARIRRFDLVNRFSLESPLLRRAAWGSGWLLSMQIAKKALTVVQTVVVARVLQPEDLGLFGITLIAVSFVGLFTQISGFQTALIQRQGERRAHLDTAWTVLVAQGFLNALFLVLLAEPTASFFGEPRATLLIRIYSIAIGLNGFVNIGIIYFHKELQFSKQFVFVLLETVASVSITIITALLTRSVWALVAGAVGGSVVRLVSSFLLQEYRPRLRIHTGILRELFSFGGWIWLGNILQFFQLQGDNVVVGRLFGTAILGFYRIAYSVTSLAGTEAGNILSRVSFPVYAKLQNDSAGLKDAYLKFTGAQALITLPIAVGVLMLASELVRVVLGEVWLPAVPVMRILVAFSFFDSMVRRAEALLQGLGAPQFGTAARGLFLLVAGFSIYPMALLLGLPGVAVAVAVGSTASWVFIEFWALKKLALTAFELFLTMRTSLVAGGGMALILAALKSFVEIDASALTLVIQSIAGLAGYLLIVALSSKPYGALERHSAS